MTGIFEPFNEKPKRNRRHFFHIRGGSPWNSLAIPAARGRPWRLFLFPKAVLHQIRNGGTLAAAYRAIAEKHYDAPSAEFGSDDMTDAEFDQAFDKWERAVKNTKRQIARELKRSKPVPPGLLG